LEILESRKHTATGLVTASLIWLLAIAAAFGGGVLRGLPAWELAPYAIAATIPALMSLILSPVTDKDWARILVIFAWLSLAIIGCVAIGFIPTAILFLCAPAAAALFARETVIETIVLSALFATAVYFAGRHGWLPDIIASDVQQRWGLPTSVMAAIAFVLGSLFGVSSSNRHDLLDGPGQAAVLNRVPGAVMRVNKDNAVTYASDEASTMFGLDSAKNLDTNALFQDDDPTHIAFENMLSNARNMRSRQSMRATGRLDMDRLTHMKIVTTPLPGDEQLVHITDVSDHENSLASLRAAQQDAVRDTKDKSLFFAGVSHELRTPLNAIIGFSDMMRSRLFGPLPGKYAEYADLIHDSGQHMLDLIGDVLDMSKVDAGKYELQYGTFDAADVIRSSVKMIRPSADAVAVEIDTEIVANHELIIDADRKAVRQMLLNLLSNAVKFTPKGGKIEVKATTENDMLNISVSDNGMGMSPEELGRIGEPYAQGESADMIETRGTGLGLSLVKSLADLHKGRFAVTSQKGEGTVVDIYLPLDRQG